MQPMLQLAGTGCSKEQDDFYIGLSPFTWWQMDLPGTFDYSKVSPIIPSHMIRALPLPVYLIA